MTSPTIPASFASLPKNVFVACLILISEVKAFEVLKIQKGVFSEPLIFSASWWRGFSGLLQEGMFHFPVCALSNLDSESTGGGVIRGISGNGKNTIKINPHVLVHIYQVKIDYQASADFRENIFNQIFNHSRCLSQLRNHSGTTRGGQSTSVLKALGFFLFQPFLLQGQIQTRLWKIHKTFLLVSYVTCCFPVHLASFSLLVLVVLII